MNVWVLWRFSFIFERIFHNFHLSVLFFDYLYKISFRLEKIWFLCSSCLDFKCAWVKCWQYWREVRNCSYDFCLLKIMWFMGSHSSTDPSEGGKPVLELFNVMSPNSQEGTERLLAVLHCGCGSSRDSMLKCNRQQWFTLLRFEQSCWVILGHLVFYSCRDEIKSKAAALASGRQNQRSWLYTLKATFGLCLICKFSLSFNNGKVH